MRWAMARYGDGGWFCLFFILVFPGWAYFVFLWFSLAGSLNPVVFFDFYCFLSFSLKYILNILKF
jgi:hypothetical protein